MRVAIANIPKWGFAMLESRIESKTTEYAESLGMMHLKLNVKGRIGWPDHIYVWNGRTWFVEFKQYKVKPEPVQLYIHSELRKRGAVVRSIDNLIDGRIMINELFNLPPVCS